MPTTNARAKTSTLIILALLYALSAVALVAGIVLIIAGYGNIAGIQAAQANYTEAGAYYGDVAAAQSLYAIGTALTSGAIVTLAIALFATFYRIITFPKPERDVAYEQFTENSPIYSDPAVTTVPDTSIDAAAESVVAESGTAEPLVTAAPETVEAPEAK